MASRGKSEGEVRKDRLAAALRENLKRRKAQARAKGMTGSGEKTVPASKDGPKQAAKSAD